MTYLSDLLLMAVGAALVILALFDPTTWVSCVLIVLGAFCFAWGCLGLDSDRGKE